MFVFSPWRTLGAFTLLSALVFVGCSRTGDAYARESKETRSKPAPPSKTTSKAKRPHKPQILYAVRTQEKVIALTLDDGPHPTYTPQVLAVLKKKQVPATFFMVGSMVKAYPKVARQVKDAGHEVAAHSWSHPARPKSAQHEIERTNDIIEHATGTRVTLFRPPYGMLRNGLAQSALKQNQHVVIWSCLGNDWESQATARSISAKVLRHAGPGGIILLHDAGGHRRATVAALPIIIDTLKKRGFRFVTVSQLLKKGPPVTQKPAYLIMGNG